MTERPDGAPRHASFPSDPLEDRPVPAPDHQPAHQAPPGFAPAGEPQSFAAAQPAFPSAFPPAAPPGFQPAESPVRHAEPPGLAAGQPDPLAYHPPVYAPPAAAQPASAPPAPEWSAFGQPASAPPASGPPGYAPPSHAGHPASGYAADAGYAPASAPPGGHLAPGSPAGYGAPAGEAGYAPASAPPAGDAGYAPAGYPASGPPAGDVAYAATGYGPASTTALPAADWAASGQPLGGSQLAPGQPPRRPRDKSRTFGWIAFGLAVVLLLVAIAQTVFLVKLSGRADDQAAELRASNARLEKTRSELESVSKRIAGVDDRTKGTLNSTAVAAKVLPSVLRVRAGNATGTAFAFGKPTSGTGTLFVTNFHVVENVVRSGSRNATLERGAVRHTAQIVKMDERRDIAVLQVAKDFPLLLPARAAVQPGEPVVVVGAPLGLADSVTTGVVSAVRADVPGIKAKVIQFDAAISPGNSGGPVSNAQGQVVGVAQAKIIRDDADGLALAIPINEVCDGLVDC